MRVQFGISAHERARGDLPELPVINMFAEAAPTEEGGVVLQSRPAIVDRSADMGSGPVKALFKADGVLDSGLYGVSGSNLYSGVTSLGSVSGSGHWSLAGYEDNLFAAGGGSIYNWDGVTLGTVSFPDSANVIKILVGAARLVAIRSDTETYYWSDALTTTITGLSFTAAENQPDRLRDMLFIDDILVLGGAETVEFHANTGDADLPFQAIEGRVWEVGVKNTGAMCRYGTTIAVVTNTNQVVLGDQDNVVSNPGIEARIAAESSVKLWTFYIDGTEMLALTLSTETLVFNKRAGTFSNFESYGQDNFIPQCYAGGVLGSSLDGTTYEFSGHVDAGTVLERRFRFGFPINGGGVMIDNIMLRCNPGGTTYLSGDYADPVVELRLSRDAGHTWDEWRPATLGRQGKYRKKVMWVGLGMAASPGLLGEIRVTAPVDFRVSDVRVNEPYGGL